MPQLPSQIVFVERSKAMEMAKVMRFRRLKHGAPEKFKVLPEDLARSRGGAWFGTGPGMLGVIALVGASIAMLALVGGLLG
jgi:hypothetical protein